MLNEINVLSQEIEALQAKYTTDPFATMLNVLQFILKVMAYEIGVQKFPSAS